MHLCVHTYFLSLLIRDPKPSTSGLCPQEGYQGLGMAQLVKFLLREHEALSLISGTHTKMLGLVACAYYPSIGEVETHGFLGLPV